MVPIDYTRFLSVETQYMRASEIRELLKLTEKREVISFAGGLPDPQTFPVEEIAEIVSYVIKEYGASALQYGPTKGVTRYILELVDFLKRNRGIEASPEEVIVTVGSQQALDILARILIDPGDYVVVEEPTYLATLNAFRPRRPNFVGVPIDNDGMIVDILEEKLRKLYAEGKRVKFVYTIPIAQNPGGVTLSRKRKEKLVELAEQYNFLIIEDDVYGLLVFEEGVDRTPIKRLAPERTIYLGSFSKVLSPGMRLGHVIAPKPLTDVIEKAKQAIDLHAPTLTQYIAMEALRRRVIERNIPKIISLYKAKRDAMLEALKREMPEGVWWSRPVGGVFIWLKLNANIDTSELLPKAIERGVAYVPGKSFYHDLSGIDTMRLSFSKPTIEEIDKGIRILGEIVRDSLKKQ
ncbi:MAG: PLP-dependent aminotransferase family protein [Ignisphaera sp.]|nr:PLP-dependent aminotransferase family protein [Ignisphaera sp.]